MRKNLLYLVAGLLSLAACTKTAEVEPIFDNYSQEVKINHFSSSKELDSAINSLTGEEMATKSSGHSFMSLFALASDINVFSDPVLSAEAELLKITPSDCTGSIYDLLGYDWLVPNESFAQILNFRGEVEVCDTIYKVSPRGTFYFHKSCLDAFESNYAAILNSDYTSIAPSVYVSNIQEADGIKLFDSYNSNCDLIESYSTNASNDSTTETLPTKSIYINDAWVDALNINWNSFPLHYTDARTWAGEVIEGVFGRNVSFENEFDSKHRLKAKLYYYNYVVYSEIGAKSKMQKKNAIGWSKTNASKIYQIWNNIVIWTPFQNTVQYPHVGNSTTIPRYYLGTATEEIPGTSISGLVAYYAGRDLSDSELSSFANANYVQNVLNLMIENLPANMSNRIMAAKYITERGIYTVVYPYGKSVDNDSVVQSKFSKDFHIQIGLTVTPGALPGNFMGWLQSASAQSLKTPKLKTGEMRTAAIYNGQTKGMRIVKQYEDE